ncbi:gliding motility-associated C-terminal domain-containing protein [Chitinophaga sp.]|uniref:T9SS type B sorting domain-containing protein n=1 Tax=Chitinophaga sp. TaxID=1869181 RepID=UPI0031DC90E6
MKALQLTGSGVFARYRLLYLLLFILPSIHSNAQIIPLKNPSLEGTAGLERAAPPEWSIIEETPDIQPGVYGLTMPASDGNTYVGMVANTYIQEGITQLLVQPLDSGKSYSLSFDLAYAADYSWAITYGGFAIYGGNEFGKREELLWASDRFMNTQWKRQQAVFTPSNEYKYIILSAYKQPGDSIKYIAGVLVDNFSPIREVIQLSLSSENSCNGSNGVAWARVANEDDDEYSYLWSTGDTCARVKGLKNGEYHVTVRGKHKKTSTYGRVKVQASELSGSVHVSALSCNGAQDGVIFVAPRGGVKPFYYYLNDATSAERDSVFSHLAAGKYKVRVMDAGGCTAVIDKIELIEPSAIVVKNLSVTPESCAGNKDGSVRFDVEGGAAPYRYTLPGYADEQAENVVTKLAPGNYSYSVLDRHQCEVTGNFEVRKGEMGCSVFIPTAFSPNGDGVNDLFRAVVHDQITNFSMRVFSRWGQVIFESRQPGIGWDGTVKGVSQDPGGYLYVVTYVDGRGQEMKQQGTLVLVR